MPHVVWETLTPFAQKVCRHIKEDPGVWPEGAGEMLPLAAERKYSKQKTRQFSNFAVGGLITVRKAPVEQAAIY